MDNVDIDGNATKVTILDNGGDNNTYQNLEIRHNTDIQMITNGGSSATYDHVFFHDAVMTTAGENAGIHMECMWSNGPNLTIRDSVFRDCAIMDLFLTRGSWWGQANVCCVTLENNIFWPSERINNGGVHFYSVSRSRQRRLHRPLQGSQQPFRPSIRPQRQPRRELRLLRQHRPDRAMVGTEVLTLAPG